MAALLLPFFILAAIGLAAMLAIHVSALGGFVWPFDHYFKLIAPGAFVVFLPAVLVMNRLTRDFKQKDLWRAALRGCPPWMRHAFYVVFGYACVGFFAFPFVFGGGMDTPANQARSMSGVLLIFYLTPVVVLYSAMHAETANRVRRCLNGHRISPLAKYCEECGAPADERVPANSSSL